MSNKADDKIRYYLNLDITPEEMARFVGLSADKIRTRLKKWEAKESRTKERAERMVDVAPTGPRGIKRPYPPADLAQRDEERPRFVPDKAVWKWMLQTFISREGPLYNPVHEHLMDADIGIVWTNAANSKQMRDIVGLAEVPNLRGNKWVTGRSEQQIVEWFGDVPDFILTFDAVYCTRANDASLLALFEHELMHCAQRLNREGEPMFDLDGRPCYGLQGHDVEEFVGIVARYGVGAASGRTRDFVDAANAGPEIAGADISFACGTCLR